MCEMKSKLYGLGRGLAATLVVVAAWFYVCNIDTLGCNINLAHIDSLIFYSPDGCTHTIDSTESEWLTTIDTTESDDNDSEEESGESSANKVRRIKSLSDKVLSVHLAVPSSTIGVDARVAPTASPQLTRPLCNLLCRYII